MTTNLMPTVEQNEKIRHKARLYPDWWIETVLGGSLWPMQIAVAQSTFYYPRTTWRKSEACGGSYIAGRIALAFLYNYYPAVVLTTAPTNRQVEDILWKEIRVAYAGAKFPLEGNLTRKRLELSDNHYAVGFATDEPERMLGYHEVNILVIGDDAAGLTNDIFGAIENPIATGNAHLLFLSNPTQSVGAFRETFTGPKSNLYKKYHTSAFDSPNLAYFGITQEDIESGEWEKKWSGQELPYPQLMSPAKVAERYKNWGKGSYLYVVFILGGFPDAGVNNLISLSDLEFAMSREIERKEYDSKLKVAALDVARYGDDECSFAISQGKKVHDPFTWGHQDSNYTAGRTARLIRENKPVRTYIDVVGLGAGVYDILKREIGTEYKIIEYDSGKAPLDKERYLNRRAEDWWNFSRELADGELDLPDSDKLKAQCSDIRYTYTPRGLLQIESKEDAKARGSKSPDVGDSVMMTRCSKKGGGGPNVTTY